MKKVNTKSTVNQEIWRQVYDPVAGKKVMYNIYPLLKQSQDLKGKKDYSEIHGGGFLQQCMQPAGYS